MNSGLRLSARWLLAAGLRRSSREQTTQWTVDSSLYVRSSVIYICVLWRLTLKPPQYTKKRTCVVDVHVDVHARRARVPYPGSRLPVSIGRRRISRAHTFTAHSSRCTGSVDVVAGVVCRRRESFYFMECVLCVDFNCFRFADRHAPL